MTPREIAEHLARDAESVCRMLFPEGKREGSEWRVGSISREPGKSVGVHLLGEKAGLWSDFATGDGGDLLDLWAATRGLTLTDAIREAKSHLGIQEPRFTGHREKQYRRPKRPQCRTAKPDTLVALYLGEERGLPSATIDAYRIAEHGREIVFPSIRDGELIAVKYFGVDRPDGKKQIRVEADCEPCLFGWQAIPDKARKVAITEGEIDAMSLHAFGVPALSVPFGGGKGDKQRWIEGEYPHLESFDEIFLCLDSDQPGRDATQAIAERLGRHRCRVVELPEGVKDANDLLGPGASREDVDALFTRARTLDPAELKPAPDFLRSGAAPVLSDRPHRNRLPDALGALLRAFRLPPWGRVTILAGVNGHGKSEIAGHIALDALRQGGRACIASMELRPGRWLYRLTRQAAGMAQPSPVLHPCNSRVVRRAAVGL